ncbi:anti-sigma factor [Bacillus sp. FJAT-50079]|uniref:anti-sigma factor n=1 Tax=Bacillus sp. FJAT-50079 TaxID=2833577 RepID=UPI001BC91C37|nr:anti-sigma factor [Bacillus sp. FJAT-50079]MBS4209028.1 anti sigma factor C-terminal domain-containing protein [Bacillus sp. FJAT-50079]
MSDEFKRKLEAYENGQLDGDELTTFEEELAKLEQYQEYLEENKQDDAPMNEKKQKRMLRTSKWKARFQTAATAVVILILFTIVSSILTAVYYSWGEPDRSEVFADVIDYTLAVTEPYDEGFGHTSTNAKPFFKVEMTRDLNKRIGREREKVGDLKVDFLFSLMGYPERNYTGKISQNQPHFIYPGFADPDMSEWDKLEQLPEGTVVSAYISFDQLMETSAVFDQFGEKDLDIIWFAVDTGVEGKEEWDHGTVFNPIGFPEFPLWHDNDMIAGPRDEQKGFLFGKIVSQSFSSPDYEEGDSTVLHKQFLKTLSFLEQHEKKAEKLYHGYRLHLEERLNYVEKNGINHYGIVVTGPTKEILALKDDPFISYIQVDEVDFWNW